MPTQSTNIVNAATDGIDFTADPQTWTIAAGALVASTHNDSVFSNFNSSRLLNFGQVFGGVNGVFFDGDNGTIVNHIGGEITGVLRGVNVDGNHETIDNLGSIVGFGRGVVLNSDSNNVKLINKGSIYGHVFGVEAFSQNEGGTIANFGAIRSDGVGVHVITAPGFTTLITNAAKGIIEGTTNAIDTFSAGAIFLKNYGTVIGNIDCTVAGAHDVIINHGKIKGLVKLDSGNDVFKGAGGDSGAIFAGNGNDRIIGGNGNLQIHVTGTGTGSDTLTGGPGHDRFFFEFAPTAGQVETITNFKPALDKIVLSETADFMGIGPLGTLAAAHFHVGAPVNGNAQIDYTPGNGSLYYDPNGNAGPQIHFATLTTHPALSHANFIVEA